MKAIIPLAGKGTRLRPHTHITPKPLVKVGGRPVMSYILDDLIELGVREVVFIVGYLGDVIRDFIAAEYPELEAHYVVQEVQDGTAGAVKLAEPWADEDLLILFVDTIFDADLSLVKSLGPEYAGVIWAKEVEDYQRFGVIITRSDLTMERIVEKPKTPVSKLANIGLYYIRDFALLFEGLHDTISGPPGPGGEYFLTDAFQYMVAKEGPRYLSGARRVNKIDTNLTRDRDPQPPAMTVLALRFVEKQPAGLVHMPVLRRAQSIKHLRIQRLDHFADALETTGEGSLRDKKSLQGENLTSSIQRPLEEELLHENPDPKPDGEEPFGDEFQGRRSRYHSRDVVTRARLVINSSLVDDANNTILVVDLFGVFSTREENVGLAALFTDPLLFGHIVDTFLCG